MSAQHFAVNLATFSGSLSSLTIGFGGTPRYII
jgi:hypothetical protein